MVTLGQVHSRNGFKYVIYDIYVWVISHSNCFVFILYSSLSLYMFDMPAEYCLRSASMLNSFVFALVLH